MSRSAGHPRESGEQMSPLQICHGIAGSSPRERGTGHARKFHAVGHRVIPARAGNRQNVTQGQMMIPGHPRESGEQAASKYKYQRNCGSSPRERGTVMTGTPSTPSRRVIPARAGNRAQRLQPQRDKAGHPRESGEQCSMPVPRRTHAGSSPRERGTGIPAGPHVP